MSESFSLQLWRAVGRHDELQPALAAALAAARPRLPIRLAAIRYLVPQQRLWETVAIAGDAPNEGFAGVDRVPDGRELSLPPTLRRERMLMIEARSFSRAHPAVIPHAARGSLVLAAIELVGCRGQSVLDGLRWIRVNKDPSLAIRFSCINANACKECMMELDGETVYACTARLEPREMTVAPLPNKKLVRDLVTEIAPPAERFVAKEK